MHEDKQVIVYNFIEPFPSGDSRAVSTYKATRSVIRALGGTILEGTAQEVPAEELDRDGRWRRVATGWGELRGA